MRTPTTLPLEPGEQVRETWLANHTQHAQRATGGRLYLTDRRLVFEPHAVDRALDGKVWSVPLRIVTGVDRSERDLSHFFGGGLRRRLRVRLDDGSEWFFVVNRTRRCAETLRGHLPAPS